MLTYIDRRSVAEHNLGYCNEEDGEIGINLTSIWTSCSDEQNFMKKFGKVFVHELIHREIQHILGEHPNSAGEEKICDVLANIKNEI